MGMRHYLGIMAVLFCVTATPPTDVPGSKDPAFLKRYQGSEIVLYVNRSFDQYPFFVPDTSKPGTTEAKIEQREGAVTRIYYSVPKDHTALELFRNYEQALKEAGFSIVYELLPCRERYDTNGPMATLFQAVPSGVTYNPIQAQGGGPYCFFTASGNKDGKAISVTVQAVEEKDISAIQPSLEARVKKEVGSVLVSVDVVTAAAVQNNMVEVKAADIADALATKGFVDIYGINFDVDKTDVKPDSKKTLDEVASLLKIDRSLKLEISGHTDSTGDKAHNMQLSEGRAKSVVDALVKQYGIDAARLSAKGYGDTKPVASNDTDDGRAKNRRVELRKL
jgi:OmpA-OmpF porin, OOP family